MLEDLREEYRQPYGLPKTAKGLSDLLKRHAPALKRVGVVIVQHTERKSDGYHVTIYNERTSPCDFVDPTDEFDPAEFS